VFWERVKYSGQHGLLVALLVALSVAFLATFLVASLLAGTCGQRIGRASYGARSMVSRKSCVRAETAMPGALTGKSAFYSRPYDFLFRQPERIPPDGTNDGRPH